MHHVFQMDRMIRCHHHHIYRHIITWIESPSLARWIGRIDWIASMDWIGRDSTYSTKRPSQPLIKGECLIPTLSRGDLRWPPVVPLAGGIARIRSGECSDAVFPVYCEPSRDVSLQPEFGRVVAKVEQQRILARRLHVSLAARSRETSSPSPKWRYFVLGRKHVHAALSIDADWDEIYDPRCPGGALLADRVGENIFSLQRLCLEKPLL